MLQVSSKQHDLNDGSESVIRSGTIWNYLLLKDDQLFLLKNDVTEKSCNYFMIFGVALCSNLILIQNLLYNKF